MKNISLDSSGLSRASKMAFEKDFTFYVGENSYQCTKFQAIFLSPLVAQMLLLDPTADFFTIDYDDKENHFLSMASLMNGDSISIKEKDLTDIISLFQILGNTEMIRNLSDNKEITVENAVSLLILSKKLRDEGKINSLIEFIASHFDEISTQSLLSLDDDFYELILSNPKLFVADEDSLFDKIIDMGEEHFSLIKYVRGQCLTTGKAQKYLDIIRSLDYIDSETWDSISTLIFEKQTSLYIEGRHKKIPEEPALPLQLKKGFKGIFEFLSNKCQGDPVIKGEIAINSSISYNNVPSLILTQSNSFWSSVNVQNAFVMFDFKDKAVHLTGYEILSANSGKGFLINWAVEGSNNKIIWDLIDQRFNMTSMANNHVDEVFSCVSNFVYQYIRIRQTAPNSSNYHSMKIGRIEFFGSILNKPA